MRHILRYIGHRLYTSWATFWFAAPFFATYPVQRFLSQKPGRHRYMHGLNRLWAKLFITMWGVPVETVLKSPLPPAPVVYVANHSSYIDIPLLFYTIPGWLNIMGKSSLAKVPLWGPIFGRTYITVDRDNAISRGRAMVQARRTLDAGRSIIIFPEGSISKTPGEQLAPFKDGAFQLAVAAGVPIVPVTMPLNHRFMPDVDGLRVRHSPLAIIVHEPVPTAGLTTADVPALRQRIEDTIASALRPEAAGIPEASTWRRPKKASAGLVSPKEAASAASNS